MQISLLSFLMRSKGIVLAVFLKVGKKFIPAAKRRIVAYTPQESLAKTTVLKGCIRATAKKVQKIFNAEGLPDAPMYPAVLPKGTRGVQGSSRILAQ